MSQRTRKIIAFGSSVLVVALGAIPPMQAQSQTLYPSLAPLDRYRMPDQNAEIAGPRCGSGQSKAQIREAIATFAKEELPPLEPGALTYMLNSQFAREGIDVFMVLTGTWSDGTPAPVNS